MVYFDKSWRTFPDFLAHYIIHVLDADFFRSEANKSPDERHPVSEWHDQYHGFLSRNADPSKEVHQATACGVVYSYIGLAYNLYLLSHNVELQRRLIERLKRSDQFQGAYYELIVANSLIRAGFELVLEDETDTASKHCEFAAFSRRTGKKYWVEAKARGVEGVLGKTRTTGIPASRHDPTTSLTKQISDALAKPAAGPRLIFIDLNCPWTDLDAEPKWINQAQRRLKARERDLADGQSAYVFVTNAPFHLDRESARSGPEVMVYGLGISDFAKPGSFRLGQLYRMKQKHLDAHNIVRSLVKYPAIPVTLDGRLPSESFGRSEPRCLIGETYFFEGINLKATVVDAAVLQGDSVVCYSVTTEEGKNLILSRPLSADELAEYQAHPEGYFGIIKSSLEPIYGPCEFFEFVLEQYKHLPRAKLLDMFCETDLEKAQHLSDEDLLIEVCERLAASMLPRAA
jgi:hypothetical protein